MLGSSIDSSHLQQLLTEGAVCESYSDEQVLDQAALMLADGAIIGWVQGRMEFGPRALGNRSILADPRRPDVQQRVNQTIKRRESFRPFAPAVTEEDADRYFDMRGLGRSPYMLFTLDVRQRANREAMSLPGVTHVDGTARVQTVSATDNPRFYQLLRCFEKHSGVPVLLNTSFNVRGEPLVCSALDAYRCFAATQLDAVVIGQALFRRSAQPPELLARMAKSLQSLEPD